MKKKNFDLNKFSGEQARSFKNLVKFGQANKREFMGNLNFNDNAESAVRAAEKKQTLSRIKDQIDYFGYEIEPFHMKNERDIGDFDKGGFFVFNRQKDQEVNDRWLDQLDQTNVFQELQEKALQQSSKQQKKIIKEANKKHDKVASKAEFFKSRRFASKEEAERQYNNEIQQQKDDKSEESEELEIPMNKGDDLKSCKAKTHVAQEEPLEKLGSEQLREILYDLLEENETPTQAIKRYKALLALNGTKGTKQPFKKNVRKQVKADNKDDSKMAVEPQEEVTQTLNQALSVIVGICTVIQFRMNDPEIYSLKKEDLKKSAEGHDSAGEKDRLEDKESEADELPMESERKEGQSKAPGGEGRPDRAGVEEDADDDDNIF